MSTAMNPATGMPFTPEELMRMQMMPPGAGAPSAPGAAPAQAGAMPRPSITPFGGMGGPMAGAMGSPVQSQASTGALPQTTTGIDPSVQAAMLGTYGDTLELGSLEKQLAEANALRDTALPEMRGGGGRVQTAANPLEFIGAGIKQYKGIKEGKAAKEAIKGKQGDISTNVKKYGGALLKKDDEDK